MLDFIHTMRDASYIKRYHTRRIIGEQTNGQHSFNVVMLAIAVTNREASGNLIKACLYHDMPELATSDVSAPLKLESPVIAKELLRLESVFLDKYDMNIPLTLEEQYLLKFCDTAELCYYCVEQIKMGNSSMQEVFYRGFEYLTDHLKNYVVIESTKHMNNMHAVKNDIWDLTLTIGVTKSEY